MSDFALIAKVSVAAAVYSIDKPYDYRVPKELLDTVREGQRVIVPFGRGNRKTEGFVVKLAPDDGEGQLKYISHLFDDDATLSEEDIAVALWMRQRYFCTFFEAANAMLPPGMWNKNSVVYGPGEVDAQQALQLAGRGKARRAVAQAVFDAEKPLTEAEIEKISGVNKAGPHIRQLVKLGAFTASHTESKKIADKMIWSISLAIPLEQARLQAGRGKLAERRLKVIECVAQAGHLPEKEVCYLTGVGQSVIVRMSETGIFARQRVEAFRRPKISGAEKAPQIELNHQQAEAFEGISALLDGKPHAAMLMGVTGSGKTQVYIKLIKKVLEGGKNAVMLVPEIALTPQMVRIFYSHFGDNVAVVHSGLTYAQRYDEYKRIRRGKARVVVGTRTGVFAPLRDIGIIIIDEEQEYSYKSDSDPRYHARDIAKYRSVIHGCLLLLGSATPSVVSFHSAAEGRYKLFKLTGRYNDTPLPETVIDDMRRQLTEGDDSQVGKTLIEELGRNLERGEQSILFINRRGSARMAMCADCGYVPQCQNCSVAMVFHGKNSRLMCHHCGYSEDMPETCPQCGGRHIRMVGSGTQSVEAELGQKLPGARLLRMDADTTVGRTSHEALLDAFGRGKADILIGTQMVAKGLDFDNVTLVGVLDADLSLYQGEYHAGERTFSLLAQVVGRAGRRLRPGRAVIQTFTPKNPVIEAAARQDYEDFYQFEIDLRRAQRVPPFCDLVVFTLSGASENNTLGAALSLAATLEKLFDSRFPQLRTQVLGPVPAVIARLNRRYRFTVSFRGSDGKELREFISRVMVAFYSSPYSREVAIATEVNP